jgi:N-acetylglucosamine-6-phosphate deacetylase
MNCTAIDANSGAGVDIRCDRTIASVTPCAHAGDLYVAPGWIDVQVNGYAGADYNSPATPHEDLARSVRMLYSFGVTRLYPTVITGGPDQMLGALRNLARFRTTAREGAAFDGFHVEGPFISPEDGPRGAHPKRWVRKPDFDEFRRWQEAAEGRIRIVTLSPEWPEAPGFIEKVVEQGVVASIGHTKATAAELDAAVSAGATMSTHLGNGAHAVIPRHKNYLWPQLADDRLMASFIVDGVHLPPPFVKVAMRAKGVERAVLVTDAAMPAGCKPGRYLLGEVEVDLTPDNRIVVAGSERLASSALSLDRAIGNLMTFAGLTLAEAVRLATVNPAKAGRVPGRTKGLVPGDRADLVVFRFDPQEKRIDVQATYVDGEKVY